MLQMGSSYIIVLGRELGSWKGTRQALRASVSTECKIGSCSEKEERFNWLFNGNGFNAMRPDATFCTE